MTPELNDPLLNRLRHLPIIEPDRLHSDRVRMRCRAVAGEHINRGRPAKPLRTMVVASGLAYGFAAGYLLALVDDVVRLYLRR
jgi:hypothetical protein